MAGATASGGCGQDVATCDTICALPEAPGSDCTTSCSDAQSACASSSAECGGDFQDYLTCLNNAGTYEAVDGLCAAIAARVASETSTRVGTPTGDGGTSSTCASATCSSVCATEGTAVESCTSGCEAAQAQCSVASDAFQSMLSCFCQAGGLVQSMTEVPTACESDLQAVESQCPGLSQTVDASVGPGIGMR